MDYSSSRFNTNHCNARLLETNDAVPSDAGHSFSSFISSSSYHDEATSMAANVDSHRKMQIEFLQNRFHNVQSNTSQVAVEYRDLGLQYHSIVNSILLDQKIRRPTRKLLRDNFKISRNHELPSMIQVLGLLQYTIKNAWTALSTDYRIIDTTRAASLLAMAEIWHEEAITLLSCLQRAFNVLATLQEMAERGGWQGYEGVKDRMARERYRDGWFEALPQICHRDAHGSSSGEIQRHQLDSKE